MRPLFKRLPRRLWASDVGPTAAEQKAPIGLWHWRKSGESLGLTSRAPYLSPFSFCIECPMHLTCCRVARCARFSETTDPPRARPPLSLSLSLCVWVCVCLHMCMCGRARAHTHTHATLARPAAADTQASLSATLRVRLYVHLDFLRNSANMDIRMRLHNALFINIIRHFVNMNLIPPTPSAALRHGLWHNDITTQRTGRQLVKATRPVRLEIQLRARARAHRNGEIRQCILQSILKIMPRKLDSHLSD
jgi:hypothetical protein